MELKCETIPITSGLMAEDSLPSKEDPCSLHPKSSQSPPQHPGTSPSNDSNLKVGKFTDFPGKIEVGSINGGGQIFFNSCQRDLVQDSVKNGIELNWKTKPKQEMLDSNEAPSSTDPVKGSESNGHDDSQENFNDLKDVVVGIVGPREGLTPKALRSDDERMKASEETEDEASVPAKEEEQGAYYNSFMQIIHSSI